MKMGIGCTGHKALTAVGSRPRVFDLGKVKYALRVNMTRDQQNRHPHPTSNNATVTSTRQTLQMLAPMVNGL